MSAAAAAAPAFFTSANSFAAAANSASALSAFASATFAASSASAIAMSAATGSAWGAAMCSSMCSSTLLEEHTENAYTCTRSVLPVNWKNTSRVESARVRHGSALRRATQSCGQRGKCGVWQRSI